MTHIIYISSGNTGLYTAKISLGIFQGREYLKKLKIHLLIIVLLNKMLVSFDAVFEVFFEVVVVRVRQVVIS